MKATVFFSLLLGVFLSSGASVLTAEEARPQTLCPVMGNKINKEVYADHEGKRVFFCCPACVEKFKKDPASYIKKMEDQGITLASAAKPQTVCPVMSGKINKEVYLDYKGKRVYFCCSSCDLKFNEDPEKYIKKLEDQGVELEKTPDLKRYEQGASEGEKHEHQP